MKEEASLIVDLRTKIWNAGKNLADGELHRPWCDAP